MQKTPTPGPRKPSSKKSPKKNSTHPEVDDATALQQQLQDTLKHLQPLTDFLRAVEGAGQDDLRLSWDVRLVRGKDTPFCHVHGTSSQPAILASNMKANAPSRIQNEVMEKILEPLTSSLQLEVERMTFAELAKRQGEERRPLCGSGDPFAPG